jgi:hypothetical protein
MNPVSHRTLCYGAQRRSSIYREAWRFLCLHAFRGVKAPPRDLRGAVPAGHTDGKPAGLVVQDAVRVKKQLSHVTVKLNSIFIFLSMPV